MSAPRIARPHLAALVLATVVLAAPRSGPAEPNALETLVATERAFSAMSVSQGMRDAFLEYLADDGVLFRPLAVNGKDVWRPRRRPPATLIWEPSYAEVSAAGDLGYTTGPWQLRPPADSAGYLNPDAIAHGHFISVWRRPANGPWRLVVDLGVSHVKPERGLGSGDFVAGPTPPAKRRARASADLAGVAREFSGVSEARGTVAALDTWGASDLRWNREGAMPALGLDHARALAGRDSGTVRWRTDVARVSDSADLGYVYGLAERFPAGNRVAAADSSAFLQIWRRDDAGRWKLALAVVSPLQR